MLAVLKGSFQVGRKPILGLSWPGCAWASLIYLRDQTTVHGATEGGGDGEKEAAGYWLQRMNG